VQFTSRHFGNVSVATPVGRLDHSAAESFEQGLSPLWQDPQAAALVIDFSGVDYMSSVGLRVLMIAAKQMRARKARVAAAGLQPIVAEIFAISRFDSVFEVFPTLRDALAALSPDALAAHDAAR
jgi:anti-sigma B factor antagonist/stage II sporulation protein AA (anti-sigma F factor antagonist)